MSLQQFIQDKLADQPKPVQVVQPSNKLDQVDQAVAAFRRVANRNAADRARVQEVLRR